MGAQITDTGYLVLKKPREAKKRLVELLEKHGGDPSKAAREAGVTRRQFDRWLTKFDLLERKAQIRAKVKGAEKKSARPA